MLNQSGFNQSEILIEIEKFIKDIIERSGPYLPFWDGYQRRLYCEAVLRKMPHLLMFYQPEHEYSEHIQAFWHACEKQGFLNCGEPTEMVSQLSLPGIDAASIVESFAGFVLGYAHSLYFRRCLSDRRYEQQKKRDRLEVYTRSILGRYARTLVLRVDLGYHKDRSVSIADVYFHLDRLRDGIHRRLEIFQDMLGYAICIEQGGVHGGYHLHVAIFLPGHLHQRDGFLAKQLGKMWSEITEGAGRHHSCNAEKDFFERRGLRGVGMMYRNDEHGCDNVVNAVGYLADPDKEDQYLRMKPMGRRTYFTGT